MRDYVRGAFQALAWVRMILSNAKNITDFERALKQIDQALEKIRTKAAKDFTQDIEAEIKTPG